MTLLKDQAITSPLWNDRELGFATRLRFDLVEAMRRNLRFTIS